MLRVKWIGAKGGGWCSLKRLNLDSVYVETGIYVIWKPGDPSRVVRVGQGVIVDRLGHHRNDRVIMQYDSNGSLRVTWAAVPERHLDGVEAFLAEAYEPLVGERFPQAAPIEVNLPGE